MAGRFSKRQIKVFLFYLLDWVVIIASVIVAGSWSSLTPNLRPFSLNDPSIAYPYQTHAKISTAVLATISTIIPAVLIALSVFSLPHFRKRSLRSRLWLLNTSWLGLGAAIAGAMVVTDGMKNLVGKPRPDLLARCDPYPESFEITKFSVSPERLLVWAQVCRSWSGTTTTGLVRADLLDGFRSWVSGHSSLSFAGMTYLTIFLFFHFVASFSQQPAEASGRESPAFSLFERKHHHHPTAPFLLMLALPLLVAAYVATTRFSDYRHHGVDIVLGSLLGILLGIMGWLWFGSRAVTSYGGFGGLSRRSSRDDLEAGAYLKKEQGGRGQVLGRGESGLPLPAGEPVDGPQQGSGGTKDRDLGANTEGQPKGAVQLREINPSLSTLSSPAAVLTEDHQVSPIGSIRLNAETAADGHNRTGVHGN